MKVKDQYLQLKRNAPIKVVLIKVGSFYVCYDNDAILLHYLFSYQIKDGKVGFPLGSLEKVLFELKDKMIDYLVINDDLVNEKTCEENQYEILLSKAVKYDFENKMNQLLLEKISFLIQGNVDNYNKIKDFVDEL